MSMSGHNDTSPPCSPPTPTDTLDADPEPSMANDMNMSTGFETTPVQNKMFPRFLVIEGLDPNKTLRRVNVTILDKTIEGATLLTTKREWMGNPAGTWTSLQGVRWRAAYLKPCSRRIQYLTECLKLQVQIFQRPLESVSKTLIIWRHHKDFLETFNWKIL